MKKQKVICPNRGVILTPQDVDDNGEFVTAVEDLNWGVRYFVGWLPKGITFNHNVSLKVFISNYEYENIDQIKELKTVTVMKDGANLTTYDFEGNGGTDPLPNNVQRPQDPETQDQLTLLKELDQWLAQSPMTERSKQKHGEGSSRGSAHTSRNEAMTKHLTPDNHMFVRRILNDLISALNDCEVFTLRNQFHEIDLRQRNGEQFAWVDKLRGKIIIKDTVKEKDRFLLQVPPSLGVIHTSSENGLEFFHSSVLSFMNNASDGIDIFAYSDYKIPFNRDKQFLRIIVALMCTPEYREKKKGPKQTTYLQRVLRDHYSLNHEGGRSLCERYVAQAQNIFSGSP